KNGGKAGIRAVPLSPAAHKKRSYRRIGMKDFADGAEIWINAAQTGVPLLPEIARNVGKSIYPKPIESDRFNPPYGILQEIFCDDRILRIQIRQNAEKPSVGNIAAHGGRSVWIGKSFEWIIRNTSGTGPAVERILDRGGSVEMVLLRAVEPVRQGWLCHPGMAWTNMIGHGIEKKLHALLAQGGRKFLVVVQCTQMRIDSVEIHGAVAVIILFRAVFDHRRKP